MISEIMKICTQIPIIWINLHWLNLVFIDLKYFISVFCRVFNTQQFSNNNIILIYEFFFI